MKYNLKLMLLTLAVIILVTLVIFLTSKRKESNYKPGVYTEQDTAVNKAQLEYERRKNLGVDFANGPCLTNDLLPGWVADIAHTPRQKIDDFPENQCSAFREGRAKHFVELDPDGNVIKVQ
ncbi:hypothetical protein HYW46_01735 [Candidatus Daviesbacteria bacterium]|nr:hypothetical protein [Candidatus Daviesbacteria bacterium]